MFNQIKFTENDFDTVADSLFKLFKLYESEVTKSPPGKHIREYFPKESLTKDSPNYQMRLTIERNFIGTLVRKLSILLECDPNSLILWDIDQVIGRNNQVEGDRSNRDFEIRPALPLLFQRIKEAYPGVSFGVITSASEGHLNKVVFNKGLHALQVNIEEYFEKDFLFSLRKYRNNENIFIDYEEVACALEGTDGSRKIHELRRMDEMHFIKTVRIIALRKQYPKLTIIPIDDMEYAKEIGGITISEQYESYKSIFSRVVPSCFI